MLIRVLQYAPIESLSFEDAVMTATGAPRASSEATFELSEWHFYAWVRSGASAIDGKGKEEALTVLSTASQKLVGRDRGAYSETRLTVKKFIDNLYSLILNSGDIRFQFHYSVGEQHYKNHEGSIYPPTKAGVLRLRSRYVGGAWREDSNGGSSGVRGVSHS